MRACKVKEAGTHPRVIPRVVEELRRDLEVPAHLVQPAFIRAALALQRGEQVRRVDDVERGRGGGGGGGGEGFGAGELVGEVGEGGFDVV